MPSSSATDTSRHGRILGASPSRTSAREGDQQVVPGQGGEEAEGSRIEIDEEDESEGQRCGQRGEHHHGRRIRGLHGHVGKTLPASPGEGGGENLPRRAASIMEWLPRPKAAPATETAIRAAVGDNAVTSKALRWLLKQQEDCVV